MEFLRYGIWGDTKETTELMIFSSEYKIRYRQELTSETEIRQGPL